MLRVTVELVPGGAETFRRTIGSMTIGNIRDLADVSDYQVSVTKAANPLAGPPPHVRNFTVRDHSRRQRVWKLVARVIMRWKASRTPGLRVRPKAATFMSFRRLFGLAAVERRWITSNTPAKNGWGADLSACRPLRIGCGRPELKLKSNSAPSRPRGPFLSSRSNFGCSKHDLSLSRSYLDAPYRISAKCHYARSRTTSIAY
jgi:hypothetical protein